MIDRGLVDEMNKIKNPSKTVLQAIGMNLSSDLKENINLEAALDEFENLEAEYSSNPSIEGIQEIGNFIDFLRERHPNGVGYEAGTGGGLPGYSETKGIVFQTEGVGTVKLMDLSMESEYYMERLGTLLMARYAMGHGVLREEACCELIVSAA